MKNKKVLIIGAGIAGLSAGSYLERNGYDTEIFEMHSIAGGVCTAWDRGEYTIDYCIHWLMGTKEGTGFDILWDELKALENENGEQTPIINFDEFTRIELKDGDNVRLYSDLDKLKEEFLRIAPEEEKKINKFIKDLKALSKFKTPVAKEKWNIVDRVAFVFKNIRPFISVIKYSKLTMEDYKNQWENEKMKEIFSSIIPSSWSILSLIFGMAFQHIKAAGYPVGGSLPFAKNIEREYIRLGGKINYGSKVKEIIVRDDKTVGIELENGQKHYADEVVSAADGYSTLFKMLKGNYLTKKLESAYQNYSLFPSSLYIGLGVDMDLSDYPHALVMYLPEELILTDGSRHNRISLNIYNFDPTLAPAGKTTVSVLINTWEDEYWENLKKSDPELYKKTKVELAEKVLDIINNKIPGFKEKVETIDISTPYTVKRYTNNWHGSYEGFAPTPKSLTSKFPKEIKGLENFNMIGQWTEPGGGIPTAALDGRNLARKLCKKDKKAFYSKIS
ncbi:MAG: phytoene desaturase family protein [Bacillota bacterium]